MNDFFFSDVFQILFFSCSKSSIVLDNLVKVESFTYVVNREKFADELFECLTIL